MVMSFFRRVLAHGRPTKMALIVRTDLRLSKGKIAAQCSHAAVMCALRAAESDKDKLQLWCDGGQPKVVLRVDNIEQLNDVYRLAGERNLVTAMVHDAGRTQVVSGTATTVGIGPDFVEHIDFIISKLKLL